MECPWLDERLVAHNHAAFVHESCAAAMHYTVVPLYIVAISYTEGCSSSIYSSSKLY